MKRPGWVTVVGVLGIIMSCLGLLGAGQTIMMPRIMEFQRQMFSGIERAIENEQKQSESKGTPPKQGGHPHRGRGTAPADWPPKEFLGLFNKMLAVPDWFNTWLVVSGILGLLVSGFYLYAAIVLLQLKRHAVTLFYFAAGISIGFSVVKAAVALSAASFMGLSLVAGGTFGIVVNGVLLIVTATADKQAFTATGPSATTFV